MHALPKSRRLGRLLFAALFCLPILATGCSTPNQRSINEGGPNRNIAEWDIPARSRLAIEGYDPVAYFPEGGGMPQRGQRDLQYEHGGVRYQFATPENLSRFKNNPARYEPAHGGWCSWAMIDGEKTEANPESFIVKADRLFLFYDGAWGDTRAMWLETDHDQSAAKADDQWRQLSGETKRISPPQ